MKRHVLGPTSASVSLKTNAGVSRSELDPVRRALAHWRSGILVKNNAAAEHRATVFDDKCTLDRHPLMPLGVQARRLPNRDGAPAVGAATGDNQRHERERACSKRIHPTRIGSPAKVPEPCAARLAVEVGTRVGTIAPACARSTVGRLTSQNRKLWFYFNSTSALPKKARCSQQQRRVVDLGLVPFAPSSRRTPIVNQFSASSSNRETPDQIDIVRRVRIVKDDQAAVA